MKTCTVTDSLSTWHSELFFRGASVTKGWPEFSKSMAEAHVWLGCERLNAGWGERAGMLIANGDYSGEFISCLLRRVFF